MLTPIVVKITGGEQFVAYFDPEDIEVRPDGSASVCALRYPSVADLPGLKG